VGCFDREVSDVNALTEDQDARLAVYVEHADSNDPEYQAQLFGALPTGI